MNPASPDLDLHPDFYEPIESYKPGWDYYNHVEKMLPNAWRLRQEFFWTQALSPKPKHPVQGWKIHVSTRPERALRTLETVVPICLRFGVEFKFASDPFILYKLNSKLCGRGSAGKFMTIYPDCEATFHLLLEELKSALEGEEGPYILSDRRYKDCRVLYYRYGGIQSLGELNVEGERQAYILDQDYQFIKDARNPYFTLPPHVKDRYEPAEGPSESATDLEGLFGGKYIVDSVIRFSNAGGVYCATNTQTGAPVILKEARPHVAVDAQGQDVIARLRKEHRILTKLSGTCLAPEPLDLFEEWEHCFLAQERVKGETLQSWAASHSRVIRPSSTPEEIEGWFSEIRTVAVQIVKLVEGLHSHGVIFGDLSMNNIMIDPETLLVKLIDFEGAREPGVDPSVNFYTPGFARRARTERDCVELKDDFFGLGCILAAILITTTALMDLKPEAIEETVKEIQQDFGVPKAYLEVIHGLMSQEPAPLSHYATVLADLKLSSVPLGALETTPVDGYLFTARRILDFTHHVMTPTRRDRLFPCGPGLIHPLSFDRGALGVACAWQRILGCVPEEVTEWIMENLRFGEATPGLYSGLSGIAWALLELGHVREAKRVLREAGLSRVLFQMMGLGVGLAGYGLTLLKFWHICGDASFLDEAVRMGDVLRERWTATKQERVERGVPLGLSAGGSGIALFLLYLHAATSNPEYLNVGEEALRFDLAHGRMLDGMLGFPESTQAKHNTLYPYLAHGSAGVGTALVRYFAVTGKADYQQAAEGIRMAVAQKYTVFPGLSNGLAGLGNYLLDAAEFLGDPSCLDLARRTARGLKLFEIRRESGIAFSGDGLRKLDTTYADGSTGVALFLHRLETGSRNFHFTLDELLPGPSESLTSTVAHHTV